MTVGVSVGVFVIVGVVVSVGVFVIVGVFVAVGVADIATTEVLSRADRTVQLYESEISQPDQGVTI